MTGPARHLTNKEYTKKRARETSMQNNQQICANCLHPRLTSCTRLGLDAILPSLGQGITKTLGRKLTPHLDKIQIVGLTGPNRPNP